MRRHVFRMTVETNVYTYERATNRQCVEQCEINKNKQSKPEFKKKKRSTGQLKSHIAKSRYALTNNRIDESNRFRLERES